MALNIYKYFQQRCLASTAKRESSSRYDTDLVLDLYSDLPGLVK
ncbi:hypothetical protein [Thiomicrorhabdus sp.]|nr:hypothetical protein [Thiomicrorhabdus sp.]